MFISVHFTLGVVYDPDTIKINTVFASLLGLSHTYYMRQNTKKTLLKMTRE